MDTEIKYKLADAGMPTQLFRKMEGFRLHPDVEAVGRDIVRTMRHMNLDCWTLIYLFGTPGSGKSTLASRWLRRALEEAPDHSVKWTTEANYTDALFADYKDHGERSHVYRDADFLVLDDLGTSYNQHSAERLVDLIRHRYDNNRTTFITSNRSPQDVVSFLCGSNSVLRASTDDRVKAGLANGFCTRLSTPSLRLEPSNA